MPEMTWPSLFSPRRFPNQPLPAAPGNGPPQSAGTPARPAGPCATAPANPGFGRF